MYGLDLGSRNFVHPIIKNWILLLHQGGVSRNRAWICACLIVRENGRGIQRVGVIGDFIDCADKVKAHVVAAIADGEAAGSAITRHITRQHDRSSSQSAVEICVDICDGDRIADHDGQVVPLFVLNRAGSPDVETE